MVRVPVVIIFKLYFLLVLNFDVAVHEPLRKYRVSDADPDTLRSLDPVRIRNPDPDPGGQTVVFDTKICFLQLCIFFNFIKTLDPDWIRIGIQPKMLDPDPYEMNTDPKHCENKCFK
jgi:hypothetical protein